MPTIYEEYAPYRPELTAGEQEMIDTSPDLRQVEMRIGMDRAEEQLRDWPYPESQDTLKNSPASTPEARCAMWIWGFSSASPGFRLPFPPVPRRCGNTSAECLTS